MVLKWSNVCDGKIYSWCLYQQGAHSVPLELDEPEMTCMQNPGCYTKPLWHLSLSEWQACQVWGVCQRVPNQHRVQLLNFSKDTLLRLMNNAAMTWSQDSNSASARTWQAILRKMMMNMVLCLSHILFPQTLYIENALWPGISTNFSFISEKFLARPYYILHSLMLPPAGQVRRISDYFSVWSSRCFQAHSGLLWVFGP